jgi:hypothetical protein
MVFVGVCEITLHWLLGRGTFPRLLAIYLMADSPSGKHTVAGIVDNAAPAVALGWVNGWVGFPQWSVRKLVATAFAVAVFVVALLPVYGAFIGPRRFAIVSGIPQTALGSAVFYLFNISWTFLLAGVLTYGSYVFRRDWKRRSDSPS